MSLPATFFCFYSNFTPLLRSKCKNQKTIDMKKTLLSALKHGSGILLTLFSLLCSCQVWAGFAAGDKMYFNMTAVNWWICESGSQNFACFRNGDDSSTDTWSSYAVQAYGNVYYFVVPSGTFTKVYLTRNKHSYGAWGDDEIYNQTNGISLPGENDNSNYLSNFSENSSTGTWQTILPPAEDYYIHFTDNIPLGNQSLSKIDNNHYEGYFVVPGSASNYEFTLYCSNGKYYRHSGGYTFDSTHEDVTGMTSVSGNKNNITTIETSSSVSVGIDAELFCDYSNDKSGRLFIKQYVVKNFSAGEYLYFVNGANYSKSDGTVNDNWIYSNGSDRIGYADVILTDLSGTTHTYRFSLYSGEAYESGSIYRALIEDNISCKGFVITRGNTFGGDSEWNRTSDLKYDATHVGYNTITGTAAGTAWTGEYNPYCSAPTPATGASSSVTSSTATLAATVTSGTCTTTYVGVNVYSDSSCETLVDSDETAYVDDETTYSFGITSLDPITTYYYKAYAKSAVGTTEAASSNSFTTDCISGVATTNPSTATQSACLGSATALSVTASSGPSSGYTYQWYYNSSEDKSGATPIPGATSASYTPAVVGENYYYCSVGAAGGYCDVDSNFSGKITIKGVPVVSASASSVTNYVPVTITATGVESTNWIITSGAGGYLYDTNATTVKFKGNVGSLGPVTYTIQATSNGCSGTANVTVSRNSDNCQ